MSCILKEKDCDLERVTNIGKLIEMGGKKY